MFGSGDDNDEFRVVFDEDRRTAERQKTAELMERILNHYGALNEKFDNFMDKYEVPLDYIKADLEKKKRRDKLIDTVQENVMVWVVIGVLAGAASAAVWLAKLVWANLKQA
jgi:hypothetical protein